MSSLTIWYHHYAHTTPLAPLYSKSLYDFALASQKSLTELYQLRNVNDHHCFQNVHGKDNYIADGTEPLHWPPSVARSRLYTTWPRSSLRFLHFFMRVSIYAFPSHISVVATTDVGIRYWRDVFASYSLSNLHSVISRQNKQYFSKSKVLPNASLRSHFDRSFDLPWGVRFWDKW